MSRGTGVPPVECHGQDAHATSVALVSGPITGVILAGTRRAMRPVPGLGDAERVAKTPPSCPGNTAAPAERRASRIGILSVDIKHPSGHHPGKGTKDFFLALQNLKDGGMVGFVSPS